MVRRWWWLAGAMVLLCCSLLPARQGVVRTIDGRSIEGDVADDPNSDTVTISVGNAQVAVERTDILSIDYGDDIAKQFKQRLAQLPGTDIRSRLELSRWALDKNEYALARQAAQEVMRIDPGNVDAATLLDTIAAKENLNSRKQGPVTEPSDMYTGPGVTPLVAPAGNFLSDDQINVIRQQELRSDDTVRVRFDAGVVARYLRESGQDPAEFAAMDPTEQALRVIGLGDPYLSAGVKILSDPGALEVFHRRIEPKILVGCAAAGCHGDSGTAGDFFLYRDAVATPQWYTNFYILQQYRLKLDSQPSVWGKGQLERRMVDRTHPSQSLLIQFGLPRADAELPHPAVNGWNPLFTGDQDPYYAEMTNWIGQSLIPLDPDYGFKFDLPTGVPPATQP